MPTNAEAKEDARSVAHLQINNISDAIKVCYRFMCLYPSCVAYIPALEVILTVNCSFDASRVLTQIPWLGVDMWSLVQPLTALRSAADGGDFDCIFKMQSPIHL